MKRIIAIAALISAGSAFAQAPADPGGTKPAATSEAPAIPPKGNSAAASAAAASPAASICETKAVGKDGRKLHGAAKATFMKNCQVNTLQ
jgi:hypothetical protein